MSTNVEIVQQLYVAYFNRPADVAGLNFWTAALESGVSASVISADFATQAEYKAMFDGKVAEAIIDTVYLNMFGRHAEKAALDFYGPLVQNGTITIDKVVTDILSGAQGTDADAYNNKVAAATAFTVELDTAGNEPERLAYASGDAKVLAVAKNWLGTVTDEASLTTALAGVSAVADSLTVVNTPAQTFNLTTGIDAVVGGTGNDTVNASFSTTSVFGGLDNIDGGAGTDTLNVADSATAAGAAFSFNGATIKNVETVNIATTGTLANLDLSANSAVTTVSLNATGTAASTGIKLGNAVTATVAAVGQNISVTGGAKVTAATNAAGTVTLSGTGLHEAVVSAGTGAVSVTGDALTAVTVTGGSLAAAGSISNGTKSTLTKVTLNGVDTNADLVGKGITELNMSGATTAARTVTVNNSTASHALTVNADGIGYTSAGAAATTVIVDTVATKLTINTIDDSAIDASGSTSVTSVTLTGAGDLEFSPMGAGVTSIDGSAATGSLTLGTLNAAAIAVKTGSGDDSFTVSATAASNVNAGAGNDIVTLGAVVASGSSIALGEGNDKLLGTNVAAPAASTTTVIDGGSGNDTLSADLVNAGNAVLFKNFEVLSLNSTTGLDLALLSANTITGLGMDTASTTATYQNVAAKQLDVSYVGDNSADVNTLVLTGVSGTADTFTINFMGEDSAAPGAANVQAGTIVTAGIENYSIVSGGTNAWNEVTIGANTSAKTVTVTGGSDLTLAFAATVGTAGSSGFTLVDGSAATGNITLNTSNLGVATAGLTVKTGAGDDAITLGQKATVDSGAGDDTIVVTANGGTITTGAGADIVNVVAAVAGASFASAPVITSVIDFTAGTDELTLDDQGTETFTATKINVGTATALIGGTVNALDLAAAGDGSTNAIVTWFQYAGDTYIVQDRSAGAALTATDIVVKVTGLVDLSTLSVANFNFA